MFTHSHNEDGNFVLMGVALAGLKSSFNVWLDEDLNYVTAEGYDKRGRGRVVTSPDVKRRLENAAKAQWALAKKTETAE